MSMQKGQDQMSNLKFTSLKTNAAQIEAFPDENASFNSQTALKKASRDMEGVPYYFQRSSIQFQGKKFWDV